MLPTPEMRVWSSSARFTPVCRRRSAATNSSSTNAGSTGSRAMCEISRGNSAPPGERARPPNVRWSTKRSSGPSSSNRNRIRRWVSSGALAGCSSICPDMPRCPTMAASSSSGSHRYLPRRRAPVTVRPATAAAKSSGPATCRRTARGCMTSAPAIRRPVTHLSRPSRTVSTSGSSGTLLPYNELDREAPDRDQVGAVPQPEQRVRGQDPSGRAGPATGQGQRRGDQDHEYGYEQPGLRMVEAVLAEYEGERDQPVHQQRRPHAAGDRCDRSRHGGDDDQGTADLDPALGRAHGVQDELDRAE